MHTGNLGVSALLASTVKCILRAYPHAGIRLLDGVRDPVPERIPLADGRTVELERVGVRCNKTVWRQNHLLRLLGSALFARVLPAGWKERWMRRNPYLHAIVSAQAVMDITGGDSFSDIYGMRRMVLGSLRKLLVLAVGARLVLLPQTYGPFRSRLARMIARFILARAEAIYSRDRESMDNIAELMGRRRMRAAPQLCPDVAFMLDPIRPDTEQTRTVEDLKEKGHTLIGLNISGLLYNGGYTQNNMFGLACDYRSLVRNIIQFFARQEDHIVLLVPHVVPKEMPVENDHDACIRVWRDLPEEVRGKVLVLEGGYDQNQIKYLIGLCDFFLGARMHATIAALSQFVPVVGMAYSKKFAGVFQTAGSQDCVVDMRRLEESQLLERIGQLYQNRQAMHTLLDQSIPELVEQIDSLLGRMSLQSVQGLGVKKECFPCV
ncbi:MAG: polysaccharide pyruvyl transferase family protein [Sedimentisphaerales bacterium]|nr:polysaccharide pyruvyl transferase family protein [Sedimentisphaerales bacterium]